MNTKQILAIVLAVVVAIPLILGMAYFGIYNSLVASDENCNAHWAEVQNQYQRRHDLIPRVVNATKMYINFEKSLLTDITEARSAWTDALSQSTERQIETQEQMNSVFDRLLAIVTVENYPDLKADQVVLGLIDELEGTENRISVARGRYIKVVKNYNQAIRMFPTSIVASMSGFRRRPTFEAVVGAEEAPKVPVG